MKKRIIIDFEITEAEVAGVEAYTGSKNLTLEMAALEAMDAINIDELRSIVRSVILYEAEEVIETHTR